MVICLEPEGANYFYIFRLMPLQPHHLLLQNSLLFWSWLTKGFLEKRLLKCVFPLSWSGHFILMQNSLELLEHKVSVARYFLCSH